MQIEITDAFAEWLSRLRDIRARHLIARRLDGMRQGNLGDHAAVGGGVSEMRIHFGPGYRVYFVRRGERLIVVLCGGDKGSQKRDIRQAVALAEGLE